jgi:hypothetical protein
LTYSRPLRRISEGAVAARQLFHGADATGGICFASDRFYAEAKKEAQHFCRASFSLYGIS